MEEKKQTEAVTDETSVEEKDVSGSPEQALLELQDEYAALEDRYLRQVADFQNFRRRAIEDRALSVEIGRTQIAMPMLDVLDDLRRSVEAAEGADTGDDSARLEALADGVRLVFEKFVAELERLGIKEIEAVGMPFDEERHEAIMQQPAPEDVEPGTVLTEVQKGYMIGDKVLRHSRVVVASDTASEQ